MRLQAPSEIAQHWFGALGRSTCRQTTLDVWKGPDCRLPRGTRVGWRRRGRQTMASVRYIAPDLDRTAAFYCDLLDFKLDKHNPGKFAALVRDDLTLYLSAPGAGSGGQAGGTP